MFFGKLVTLERSSSPHLQRVHMRQRLVPGCKPGQLGVGFSVRGQDEGDQECTRQALGRYNMRSRDRKKCNVSRSQNRLLVVGVLGERAEQMGCGWIGVDPFSSNLHDRR